MSRATLKKIRKVLSACKLNDCVEVYPRYHTYHPKIMFRGSVIDYVVSDNRRTNTEPWRREYICKTVSDANDCVNRIVRVV
jgi:hypothetical protein